MDIFSFERFVDAFPKILPYLGVTIEFLVICMVFSTIFAIVIATLKIKSIPVVSQILTVYISYMRGTPFLVQLMVVYYGLPILVYSLFGININRVSTIIFAEIAMVMNEAAFLGESFRGAILAVPAIQTEAGYSIGMTRLQNFTRIVLPQAIRVVIPAYGTALVGMFQSTAVLYMIGVIDIMGRAKSLQASTHHAFEAYAVVAIIYIVFSLLIKYLFNKIEIKMNYGRSVQG